MGGWGCEPPKIYLIYAPFSALVDGNIFLTFYEAVLRSLGAYITQITYCQKSENYV